MTGPVVASAAVEVVPSADTFFDKLKATLLPQADKLGQQIGDSVSAPIAEKVKTSIGVGLKGGDPAGQGGKSGNDYGDAFGKSVKTRLEAAFKTLPNVDVNLNTTEAEAKLAQIRATLVGLTDKDYINLGVNDATTLRTIAALKVDLDALTGPEHDIRVRVNAGAASVELAALEAQIESLSGGGGGGASSELSSIGSSAESASLSISQLLVPSLGAAAVAVGPLAAVGAGALGTVLLASSQLETQVKTGLTPAFDDLQNTAVNALGPGVFDAIANLQKALPQLDPLLDQFGAQIGDIADKFTGWLANGGIKDFTEYAEVALPSIERLAENAFGAVGQLLESTKQSGIDTINTLGSALGILTSITELNGQIPKTPDSATGFKGVGEGLLSQFTGNPQGVGHAVSSALGLVDQGASKLPGLASDLFGGGPLIPSLQAKLPHSSQAGPSLNSQALQQATSGDASLGFDAAGAAAIKTAQAFGETVTQYQAAASAAAANKVSVAAATAAMVAQDDAAGLLAQALQGLDGDTLGVAQAQTQLKTGNLGLSATLKSNKDSLNENTVAGLANESALQAQVQAAQAVYEATSQQTGSTVQGKAAYDASILSIENATGATGVQKKAIDDYITSISNIPDTKMTQLDIDDAAATKTLADFAAQLSAAVAGGHLGITVTSEAALRAASSANGNIFSFFANGGENHVAQIAAGTTRVWNEPETGGEAYIPLSMSKRARSESILATVAKKFGGSFQPFNSGGIVQGSAIAAGARGLPPIVLENHIEVGGRTTEVMTQKVTETQTRNTLRR